MFRYMQNVNKIFTFTFTGDGVLIVLFNQDAIYLTLLYGVYFLKFMTVYNKFIMVCDNCYKISVIAVLSNVNCNINVNVNNYQQFMS